MILYPAFAKRDCQECLKWQVNENTGEFTTNRSGERFRRHTSALCQMSIGCPKGTPEAPMSLTKQNRLAYQHYRECKAVGSFPDDAVVRRNALIVSEAVKRTEAQNV